MRIWHAGNGRYIVPSAEDCEWIVWVTETEHARLSEWGRIVLALMKAGF